MNSNQTNEYGMENTETTESASFSKGKKKSKGVKTSSGDSISNYSSHKIISQKKSVNFLEDLRNSTNRSVIFEFDQYFDIPRLKSQAKTFSMNFGTHGYLNFPKLFNVRKERVSSILTELYIYSALKGYHDGLFYDEFRGKNLGHIFEGHGIARALMIMGDFSQTKEGISVKSSVFSGSHREKLFKFTYLLKSFPKMENHRDMNLNRLGIAPFQISEYDDLINHILQDYYAKRAHGEPEKKQNDFKFERNVSTLTYNGISQDQGRIRIDSHFESVARIEEQSSYPLMNAFEDSAHQELFYIAVNGGFQIENNKSFFFSRANFFCPTPNMKQAEIVSTYYSSIELTGRQDFLVCGDVYTNTGIVCTDYAEVSNAGADFLGPVRWDKIISYLENNLGKIDTIKEYIESINTFLSQLDDEDLQEEGPEGKN